MKRIAHPIILSHGYLNSITNGQFSYLPDGYQIRTMQTVFETRRQRLKQLIEQHGSIASLNVALGWESTNARLSRIQNGSIRSGRGTKYEMGYSTAREVEEALHLPTGWMDTPQDLDRLADATTVKAIDLLDSMSAADRAKALRLLMRLRNPVIRPCPTGPRASNDSEYGRLY